MKQEKTEEMTEENILNRLRLRSSGAVPSVPENNDVASDEAITSKAQSSGIKGSIKCLERGNFPSFLQRETTFMTSCLLFWLILPF